MRKNLLLTTTALMAAVAFAATAQAGGRTASQQTAAEIQDLKARIEALEQQQADQARVEQDQAIQEQARILKLEKGGWWADTSISGRMYWNLSNIDNQHNGVDDGKNGFAFDAKRFYVSVDHKFDSVYSADVTTDFQYSSAVGATELFIKKAYLQAAWDKAFTVRFGATDMPWIPFAEGLYGYRHIEQTVVDRTKFGNSSDWGVHIMGKLLDGDMLQYQISVVNGAGYKKPNLRTEQPDVEGRVSLNLGDFTVGVGGYYGQLGALHSDTVYNDATRFNAIAAYTGNGIRLGVEYFMVNDWSHVTSAGSDKGNGYSIFGSYQFDPMWSVFGKYEHVTPYDEFSTATAREDFKNTYYNVGIQYSPVKIVDFALVYKHDAGDNGFFGDGNGTIGGTAFAAGNDGDYDEIGLFGQLRW
ncbi:MAG: hypothetical protein GC190_07205 [Alphaproteobacteria bacterium]|nr:hypothetical protein [Alphaproteobacteria bacterium]